MTSKLLSCEICCLDYDQTDHLPKFFPKCGHTICAACLPGILSSTRECPFDRETIDKSFTSAQDFPTNLIVVQQIAESQGEKFAPCIKHSNKLKFVCMVDHVAICKYCSTIGDHKGHETKHIKEIRKQADEKKEKLQGIIKHNIAEDYQKAQAVLEAGRKSIKTDIIENIKKVNDWVNTQQHTVIGNIEKLFEEEKLHSDKKKNSQNRDLNEEIQANIEALEKMDYSRNFFKALKSDIVQKTLEKNANQREFTEIQKTIESCIAQFDSEASLFLHGFQISVKNDEALLEISQNEEESDYPLNQRPQLDWETLADS